MLAGRPIGALATFIAEEEEWRGDMVEEEARGRPAVLVAVLSSEIFR